jgi:hypothetical protein
MLEDARARLVWNPLETDAERRHRIQYNIDLSSLVFTIRSYHQRLYYVHMSLQAYQHPCAGDLETGRH